MSKINKVLISHIVYNSILCIGFCIMVIVGIYIFYFDNNSSPASIKSAIKFTGSLSILIPFFIIKLRFVLLLWLDCISLKQTKTIVVKTKYVFCEKYTFWRGISYQSIYARNIKNNRHVRCVYDSRLSENLKINKSNYYNLTVLKFSKLVIDCKIGKQPKT